MRSLKNFKHEVVDNYVVSEPLATILTIVRNMSQLASSMNDVMESMIHKSSMTGVNYPK